MGELRGEACLPHGGVPPRPVPVGELDAGWTQQFTMPQKTLAVKSYRRGRPGQAGRQGNRIDRSIEQRPRMVSSRRAFLSCSGGSPDTTTTGRQREQAGVGQGGAASARLLSSRSTRAVCLCCACLLSPLDCGRICAWHCGALARGRGRGGPRQLGGLGFAA
jgi:hypothetical protein